MLNIEKIVEGILANEGMIEFPNTKPNHAPRLRQLLPKIKEVISEARKYESRVCDLEFLFEFLSAAIAEVKEPTKPEDMDYKELSALCVDKGIKRGTKKEMLKALEDS